MSTPSLRKPGGPPGAARPAARDGAERACQATDLMALISETVQLKRVGATWKGICPFHPDQNPSLSVDSEHGLWHCFGCDLSGNAITWVQRVHGLAPEEAVSWLLARAGIPDTPKQRPQRREEVAHYDYVDDQGRLLYQVVRFEPKDFRQRRPDGSGGWAWDLHGVDRVLYRLPDVLAAARSGGVVWVVEGEKDADALCRAGVVATTAAGGAKAPWLAQYTEALRGASEVVVVADADRPGYARAKTVYEALQQAGLDARVVRAKQGKDASEHLAAGLGLAAFEGLSREVLAELASTTSLRQPSPEGNGKVHDLHVLRGGIASDDIRASDGEYYGTREGLWRIVQTDEGPRLVKLTTCDIEIVDIVARNWGDTKDTIEYTVIVRRGGRERVVHCDGSTINRLPDLLGHSGLSGAAVLPRQAGHALCAMQALSDGLPTRVVYPHLGWREIDGRWLFLHGLGAIGPDGPVEGIEVEPPISGYGLPAALGGEELVRAIRASLASLAANEVAMTALLGAVWRAVLPVPPPTSLYLTGKTGLGKTALASVALAHFGPKAEPMGWSSTANAIEMAAWAAAGHIVLVDDYVAIDERQRSQLEAVAERVLRGAANHLGRSRSRPDGSARPVRHPRALIVSTGEDVPGATSQSQRARVLIVDVAPSEAPVGPKADPRRTAALSAAQEAAQDGLLAGAMAAYVTWVAHQVAEQGMAAFQRAIEQDQKDWAAAWHPEPDEPSPHARTTPALAALATGWLYWLTWASQVLPQDEIQATLTAIEGPLRSLEATQARYLAEADPVDTWVGHVVAALRAGRCHVTPRGDLVATLDDAWGWANGIPQGEHIGWVDDNGVYLIPDATHAVVSRLARDMGSGWPWTPRGTWERLLERGFIRRGDARHRFTPRINVSGRREYVLHVEPSVLAEAAPVVFDEEGGSL